MKKLMDLFRIPSAKELAQRQLQEAERALLDMHSQAEHATKMTEYYQGVVNRLTSYVQENTIQI